MGYIRTFGIASYQRGGPAEGPHVPTDEVPFWARLILGQGLRENHGKMWETHMENMINGGFNGKIMGKYGKNHGKPF